MIRLKEYTIGGAVKCLAILSLNVFVKPGFKCSGSFSIYGTNEEPEIKSYKVSMDAAMMGYTF